MARERVYEEPTARLRFLKDTLQQCWRIQWRDHDTMGAANPQTYEWRDVPRETGEIRSLTKVLEQAKAAMLRARTASIAGCEEGYGKPEKWADELFASHGDLTASIKAIDGLLAPASLVSPSQSGDK